MNRFVKKYREDIEEHGDEQKAFLEGIYNIHIFGAMDDLNALIQAQNDYIHKSFEEAERELI